MRFTAVIVALSLFAAIMASPLPIAEAEAEADPSLVAEADVSPVADAEPCPPFPSPCY